MKQFESYEQATFKHTNPTTTSDGALMVEIGPPVHRFFFFFYRVYLYYFRANK